jgi:hypothetical protein
MKRLMQALFLICFLVCFLGRIAAAQEQPKKDDDGFEAVNGDMAQQGESIPASRLVGAAYGFIFVAVLVWVATVAQRSRKLEDEVEALKKKLG